MIELKDCGSSTSQQTTTEPKAQIKQHYEKKRERERKKIKYMIQAPWQCSGNLDQNQLHGNAVEIDGSKYQRQNLNPAAIRQSKQGNLKKISKRKTKEKQSDN